MPHLLRLATYPSDPSYAGDSHLAYVGLTGADYGATGGRVELLAYTPKTPERAIVALDRTPYGDGGEVPRIARRNVTETARILIIGTSDSDLRERVGEINAYFEQAHVYQRTGAGPRVMLQWQPAGGGVIGRCEVLTGRIDWTEQSFDLGWGQLKAEAVLAWTRRPWWEAVGDLALTDLTSGLTPTPVGTALVQNTPANCFVDFSAPPNHNMAAYHLTLTHRGLAGVTDGLAVDRVWAGLRLAPVPTEAIIFAPAYSFPVGDASANLGTFTAAQLSAPGIYRILTTWGYAPISGGDLRMRPYIEAGGVHLWSGAWVAFPSGGAETVGAVVDLGSVAVPPNPRILSQGGVSFGIQMAGNPGVWPFHGAYFFPTDAYANWRYVGNGMGFGNSLVDVDDQYYDLEAATGARRPWLYRVGSSFGGFVGGDIFAGGTNAARLYLLSERGTGGIEATRRLEVSIRSRPRFELVPGP